ncbi:helix-turn-helix domain-containing protein [Nocardia donostiensis]|uniref:DNA-binding protein n=1 Tax=Nocardia donostiensis TaxID=1538463 RepID=A0A1W0B6S9_9NOCA|nr:helix-turn-helix domain-containing protein [Nocardia donostiensis]ONM46457.1 DNA-binding protein [Nocardia donostiensis]OQS14245.1 DNA-binding protein [Nocardia donostiensis]OQS18141.1 DNA-binding protein [Nocardia donostiensis]
MTAEVLEERTYIPAEGQEGLATVLSFLDAHERSQGTRAQPNYALVGVDEHDRIELPREVHQALKQIVAAMRAGKAVTVAPQSMTLTSQQAADLLGVSRPTVKRLIEKGELPAERIGTRHRLLLDDVLKYREVRRQRQYAFLAETSVDLDAEEDPSVIQQQLREARRAAAERRKSKG